MMLWCSHVQNRNDSSVIFLSKLHKRYQHQQRWQLEHEINNFSLTPIGTPLSCLKCVRSNHEMRARLATNFPEYTKSFISLAQTQNNTKKDFGGWRMLDNGTSKAHNCGHALIVQVRTDSWRWDIQAFPNVVVLSRPQMGGWSRDLRWWRSTASFITRWHDPFLPVTRIHFSPLYTAVVTIG
jgi:hypothetical protein